MYTAPKRILVLSFILASLLISIFASSTFAAGTHAKTAGNQTSDNCGSSKYSVTLYKDFDQKGDSICFQGPGSFNLTNYPGWNDQVSSWTSTGCSATIGIVVFTVDVNGQGQSQVVQYPSGPYSGNFTGTNGTLPNDSLSSINLPICSILG